MTRSEDYAREMRRRVDRVRSSGRLIPLRLELLDGTTAYRAVPDLEDETLFRAFNTPTRLLSDGCRIELARAARENPHSSLSRQADGMVFRGDVPIGKISVAFEGEERHFRDHDPTSTSDRLRMGY